MKIKNILIFLIIINTFLYSQNTDSLKNNLDTLKSVPLLKKITPEKQPLENFINKKPVDLRIKKNKRLVFLGLESKADNTIFKTLENEFFRRLSFDRNIVLEESSFFNTIRSRGIVKSKNISIREANKLFKTFGARVFVSGEIVKYNYSINRKYPLLPFAILKGSLVCYLQVLDAYKAEVRFSGNLEFEVEMDLGYIGLSDIKKEPISALDKMIIKKELISGMSDLLFSTTEGAYKGLFNPTTKKAKKKKPKITNKRRIPKRR